MKEISLNKEEFKLFNQDDQFGFFYDEDGFPTDNSADEFEPNIDDLYKKYDYIRIDIQDNVFGVKNEKKELIMEDAIEAYDIAREVKNG